MEKHILLVDDSPTMRSSASLCLRNAGFRVSEATNGREALEKLDSIRKKREELCLILTDINMPEMDGLELIRKVKEGWFKFIPILVLTTESEEEMIRRGKDAGAAGWLLKPFNPQQLLLAVKRLVWPT